MYLSILFLPFLGSFFAFFFGNFLGSKGCLFICCVCMFLSFIGSFFIFYEVILSGLTCHITLGNWISIGELNLKWCFLFDSISAAMFLIVNSVSFLVHIYSLDYMKNDPHKIRFFSYLSLFTFFMLFLVSADNFIQMFVGWEGVGLCSYLLVNFWYTRISANKASLKAIIVNRFGDFGIYMALMSIFTVFKSLDYSVIFPLVSLFEFSNIWILNYSIDSLHFICFFLFIGVIGKSAQIGLHSWLPDAMEGPTPVSALIHAATMVTAGIFLVVRCNILFEYSPKILFLLCCWGSLTSFFAASTGILQNDLKKVIAFSTCSQLGYMLFCCGLSNYSLALFHLFNHAFFKALLFLSAGGVIHALFDEQDMRKYGGLVSYLPFTYMMFFVASFSLMGFPFLTGFYSKDIILEFSYSFYNINGIFCYWLGVISALFTAIYSFRLFFLTFYTIPSISKSVLYFIHEVSNILIFCFMFLFFFSIFIGYFTKEIFISLGTDVWANCLFYNQIFFFKFESEFIFSFYKMIPVIFSILGSIITFLLFTFMGIIFKNIKNFFSFINFFLAKKWFFDIFYSEYVVKLTFYISYFLTLKSIDKGLIEYLGPFGLSLIALRFASLFKKYSSGFLFHYIFIYVFFFLLVCLFFFNTFIILYFGLFSQNFILLLILWVFCYYFFL